MLQSVVRVATGRRKLAISTAVAALLASSGAAMADTPEYWSKETFKLEKPTFVASLNSGDDDGERRASRRSAPRASASSDEDDTPSVRRSSRRQAARTSVASDKSDDRPAPRKKAKAEPKPVRVASLGNAAAPEPKPERSISGGGGIRWVASAGCLNGTLRGVLAQVAARFGSVTVNSTCRSKSHNAAVGGASRSMHLTGDAADFRIHGNWGAASGFIRGMVGGFKHYGGGLFHIDTGSKRTW